MVSRHLPGKNALNARVIAWVIGCGTGLVLSGCARIDQATLRLTSTHVDALVVVDSQVLSGQATLYPDRNGLLQAESTGRDGKVLSCSGQLRYTSSKAGSLRLSCNNGTQAEMPYIALDYTRGYGRVRDPDRVVSFTFGMEADEAQGWLLAPAGKRVVAHGDTIALE